MHDDSSLAASDRDREKIAHTHIVDADIFIISTFFVRFKHNLTKKKNGSNFWLTFLSKKELLRTIKIKR